MATSYIISKPDDPSAGPFCSIVTGGGELVALQAPEKWAERIVLALKLLDAYERDSRIMAYIEKLKREMKSE